MRILTLVLFTGMAVAEPPPSSELLRNAGGANEMFAAIGQFRASVNCSGSLIDPSGAGAPGAKAWFLTAGHCISFEPYGVIQNQSLNARVQFRYFVDTPASGRVTIQTRATGWATMKTVDLALVELDATLGDLSARGIRPLRLAAAAPEAGRAVFWTGMPGSPIPAELQYLRRGRCTLGERVQLIERRWIWNNALSNDCPDLYGGASGSPLFDAGTNEIIGVIGTSNLLNVQQGPDYDCQINRPCVLQAGGPVMQKDTSYAAGVQGIGLCFNQANTLDVRRPGCPLDPGFQLTVQSGPNEVRPEVDGKPATWDATLTGSQAYYAYKRFPIGYGDCGQTQGYSRPVKVTAAPVISDPIGFEDGYYLLCVIAGNTPEFDSSWQQPEHATIRFKRLDSQPPIIPLDYEIEQLDSAYRLTFFTGNEGGTGLGPALQKRGPPSVTDCDDPKDYRIQIWVPDLIRPSDMPLRICSVLADNAGNAAAPSTFDFGAPAMMPYAARNAASGARGKLAPGSSFRVETFNLTSAAGSSSTPVLTLAGVRLWLVDSDGRTWPVPMTTAGPLFLEAVMPKEVPPGEAVLVVQPPDGPRLSQPVSIRPTSPGLFDSAGRGAPSGFAYDRAGNVWPLAVCPAGSACWAFHLPVSSTGGGLVIALYATGLGTRPADVKVRVGTYTLQPIEVRPHAEIPGVDELHFLLPQDFPLRLFQAVAAETPDGVSNYFWLYLE